MQSPMPGTPGLSAPPPGWRTPGIPSFGTPQDRTPVSQLTQKPKKPPGSEGRYIVYYDEDDVEIHRKSKGPGRLPRGAFIDRNGNYGVKGCILDSKGQIVTGAALDGLSDKQKQDKKDGTRVTKRRNELGIEGDIGLQREARRTRASIGGDGTSYLDRSERAVRRDGGVNVAIGADGRPMPAVQGGAYGMDAGMMMQREPGLRFSTNLDGEFLMVLYGQDAEEVCATSHGFDVRSLTEESNRIVREWLKAEQDEAGDECRYKTTSDIPAIALDGHLFALHEVYAAAQTVGGCKKVQSWKLVSDMLLRNRAELTRADEMQGGGQGGYAAAIPRSSTVAAAARVQRFFYERLLDRVEMSLKGGESDDEGQPTESGGAWQGFLLEGDQTRLVVQVNGRWLDAPSEGLVLRSEDGMFHHAEVPYIPSDGAGTLQPILAKRFDNVDGSIENVKWWWDKYTLFNSLPHRAVRQPDHWVVALLADRDVDLFRLYHEVMRQGGLYSVVANDKWWHVMTQIGVQWYHSAYTDLLKCYARHLYAYEVYETKNLKINEVSEHLFAVPLTAAKAAEQSKGNASKAIHNAEAIGKVLKNLESGEGRAGLAGSIGNGVRNVWERAGCGAAPPDLEWERDKRLCRAVDSAERRELGWAMGTLAANALEGAESEAGKVPVLLSEQVLGALCRFVVRMGRDEFPLSSGRLLLLSTDVQDNMHRNIVAALSILKTYASVPHVAAMCAKSSDVAATLARCLESDSVDVKCAALEMIGIIAPQLPLAKTRLVDCFNTLLRPPCSAPPRLVSECFRTVAYLAQLPDNGEELASSLDPSLLSRAVALVIAQHDAHASPTMEDSAMNFILALSRSTHSLRRMLASSPEVVGGLVSVACGEMRHKAHRAAASRALRAINILDCAEYTDSLLAREETIASACLSLSLGAGSEDVVANLGALLLHMTSLREREKRRAKLAEAPEPVHCRSRPGEGEKEEEEEEKEEEKEEEEEEKEEEEAGSKEAEGGDAMVE